MAGNYVFLWPEIMALLARYDDNLQRRIEFYTASLEDIVIAKLFSDRPQDRQDLISDEVLRCIDWNMLHYLATDENEVKAVVLNERRNLDFLHDYKEYVGRYGPHENADA